jgi:hypothetical protein
MSVRPAGHHHASIIIRGTLYISTLRRIHLCAVDYNSGFFFLRSLEIRVRMEKKY